MSFLPPTHSYSVPLYWSGDYQEVRLSDKTRPNAELFSYVGRVVFTEKHLPGVYRMIESAKYWRDDRADLLRSVMLALLANSSRNIRLEAENAVLRHQVIVLRRQA